ncbi:tRNA (adenosine(37)-N6)-threonylcarbamoyltransferase complex dimerization subunit type 1 TsaB [Desulfobotulus sp. H1]|uniref:tRNA (Adenosine(37)-N6)-threonylcarbamoyltransferase complex dimerization subunit type 1 TsaB n=1 Tax=Desulfobotulus pelophilus TaxID=2823377 RepID=A0ABT3N9H5_9BACT|nr:tRNA (adenosine(37)-N6)-threonylcarbamoyltransferase complex dimerization subunit type 1 TsaB [Desulfobotulus pelophilus]MCW7754115.1 tRNA (adenosine(37)-N6)-threonylcarbamoyltransferase complex dimerization subunit type 1 TsaB [Desulfobotulus pelophilus]
MKLLAADTTTAAASVCILDGQRVLAACFRNPGQTHSRHLLVMLEQVMADAGVRAGELDALVTTLGPGSFTGLRIGVSTLKGLAVSCGLPMFGFSTLEVLAARFLSFSRPVCAMVDARRGEVYAQLFDVSGPVPEARSEACAASLGMVLEQLEGSCLFVGSGAVFYKEQIQEVMGERALWPGCFSHDPDAREAGLLARIKGPEGAVDPSFILPLYLRKSDAEMNWK